MRLATVAKAGEVLKVGARGRYIHPARTDLDNRHTPDNHDNRITSKVVSLDEHRRNKGEDNDG